MTSSTQPASGAPTRRSPPAQRRTQPQLSTRAGDVVSRSAPPPTKAAARAAGHQRTPGAARPFPQAAPLHSAKQQRSDDKTRPGTKRSRVSAIPLTSRERWPAPNLQPTARRPPHPSARGRSGQAGEEPGAERAAHRPGGRRSLPRGWQ